MSQTENTKELKDKYLLSKFLEDRLFTIYESSSDSPISAPINDIQNRLVGNVEEIGLKFLLNYQTQRIGNLINLSIYSELYPHINKAEIFKEPKQGITLSCNDNSSEITKIANNRKSIRDFSGEQISFNNISNILLNSTNIQIRNGLFLRNTPSGGGLYPIDIYLYAHNIKSLDQNIYKFNPFYEKLNVINCDYSKIKEVFQNNTSINLEKSSGVIIFTFDYLKVFQKYGELALSLGFIEIGIISQNIHLFSVLYGVGTCDIGGFDKPLLESILKIDGINTHAVYAIVFGDPI
jgi:SagB-type dehydrogenase family enzyme